MQDFSSLLDLSGRTAIVTGAGSGLARASALRLAQAGARVVVADRETDAVEATSAQIRESGAESISVVCDVMKDEDLVALVDTAKREFGGLQILISTVGGGGAGKEAPATFTVEEFRSSFELNLFSSWRLAQLSVPVMRESGAGSIVFTSSVASENKAPRMSAYASSKAAVNHAVANLAHDYGPQVRINAIAPGAIRTPALEGILTPELEERMLARTPLGRLGLSEDIANAMLFLASPISSWISGQTIYVNGGGTQTLD